MNNLLLTKLIDRLGANFQQGTENVLEDIAEDITPIAFSISNRRQTEENLNKLYPFIKKAIISEYIARGTEGMLARAEGSVSNTYIDIIDKMEKDIIKSGLRCIR